MITPLGAFDLRNRLTGEFEEAQLYQGIGEHNLRDFERHWSPLLQARRATVATAEEAQLANIEDSHWDWRKIIEPRQGALWVQTFAIECDGLTQGLMLVDTTHYRCKIPEQRGQHLVYVDLLATAPWNRGRLVDSPKYSGVGQILLSAALSLSFDEGFEGRLGLHALPGSAEWYRRVCGMTDLGPDVAKQGLHYFEATSTQAKALLR